MMRYVNEFFLQSTYFEAVFGGNGALSGYQASTVCDHYKLYAAFNTSIDLLSFQMSRKAREKAATFKEGHQPGDECEDECGDR